ncbi:hypothetical protein [Amycolatopsis sp. NPDC059021]|uniref:hypothetical protein n=1 Tax=Amycolatopsis sp. NPDC059021 TaxID=3346704 RepID=UPI0036720810
MSNSGEAPFFNPPEPPARDGTLSGGPSDTFADPLSGLVTAADAPPAGTGNGAGNGVPRVVVPGPVQHDPEVVRQMVDAALREDTQQGGEPRAPEAIPPAGTGGTLGEQVAPPLGVLPRQRTWPARPPQLLRRAKPAPAPVAEDEIDEEIEAATPKKRGLPSISMPSFGRPSSSTAGVMLAVALLIVFGIVAIQMVSSLVSSVTGLFH